MNINPILAVVSELHLILFLLFVGGIVAVIVMSQRQGAPTDTGKIKVANRQDLETAISSYVAKGFVVMNKTETSTIMKKKKEFNIPIAIVGFLLCIVGLIVYAIVYACQKDQVVEIVIT